MSNRDKQIKQPNSGFPEDIEETTPPKKRNYESSDSQPTANKKNKEMENTKSKLKGETKQKKKKKEEKPACNTIVPG